MRLLFLSHRLPYPPHKGEKIRALNQLRFLARRHEVFVGCPIDDPRDFAHAAELRREISGLAHERIRPALRRYLGLAALARSRSITVECFYSRRLQRRIDELIERERIEAVFCSSSPMAEYVFRSRHAERLASVKRVMDLIDVDSFKWTEYAKDSSIWTAWVYRHEARHLAAYERRIAAEFDQLLVVTEQERQHFPGRVSADRLSAMSNGVDLEYFSPGSVSGIATHGPVLTFTGVMDYRPNVDGMCWFTECIFPRIQAAVPEVQLFIVGSRPTSEIQRLARRSGVTVTGFVDDVREYLAAASVCVVPLRIARGIQNKVLEAMAMGRAVVATPAAFEGLRAAPGRDLIVASGEAEFAAAILGLLRDRQRAAQIGLNARACVEHAYSWAANLAPLEAMLGAVPVVTAHARALEQPAAVCAVSAASPRT